MIWRLAMAILGTWRVTQFIVIDDGPLDIMWAIRHRLGRYDLGEGQGWEPVSNLGRFLECAHCVGKFVALGFAALVFWPSAAGDFVLLATGLAGAQSLIEGKRSCHEEALRVRREIARAEKHGIPSD